MRHAPGRRGARLAWPVLCFLAVFASGCLTLTSTLRPDGSGTIDLRYRLPEEATVATEKARFTSPHFTLADVTVDTVKKEAHVKGTLDEATKLSSVPFFKNVAVTRTQEGDESQLTFVVTQEKPIELPPGQPGPDITLTLPGPVTAAEPKANAETNGDTVRWRFPLDEFARAKTTTLVVRWKGAAEAKPEAKPEANSDDTAEPAAKPNADATPPTPAAP
ncbi:MAG: hypothetical protein KIT14_17580 [bacterium]|nr:hypothetical protein [bacterium]